MNHARAIARDFVALRHLYPTTQRPWRTLSRDNSFRHDILLRSSPTTTHCRSFSSHPLQSKSSENGREDRRSRGRRRRRQMLETSQYHQPTKRILFQSLGCPRNFVDTEIMLGITVDQGGLEVTQNLQEADYIVVNTCGFLQSARDESKAEIANFIATKPQQSKLLVTGCMVNLHKEQILKEYPQVDSVLGSGAIDQVMETIRQLENKDKENTSNEKQSNNHHETKRRQRRSFLEQGDTPRFLATPPHYAYLKIAEGCKKQCAFCIIPKIKGRLQSKPIPQLVDEFQAVVAHGAKEIILIAQDLGDYGKDLDLVQERKQKKEQQKQQTGTNLASATAPKNDLATLLRALLNSLDNNNNNNSSEDDEKLWIRLLYLYPDEITPDLLDVIESDSRIVRYLDMPIQHSHDDMLQSMRRKTTSADIIKTIRMLRKRLPDIQIRTSLMVGFPGETETHFEHLLQFVTEMELDNVGVFMYSDEELAVSSRLPNHVPEHIKEERYHRLMMAQLDIVRRKNQKRVDKKERLEVVVEGMQEDNRIVGRYYGQCPDIDGVVILEGNPSVYAGARCQVEVTGFEEYDLIGRVIKGP